MTNVRKVAAYVPVSRQVFADAQPIAALLGMVFADAAFAREVGRSRLTDTRAIVMWRPWPQPVRRVRAILAALRPPEASR